MTKKERVVDGDDDDEKLGAGKASSTHSHSPSTSLFFSSHFSTLLLPFLPIGRSRYQR
jgi:hypothetical protein